ncbi:MAG: nitroreductase family protein [Alistipes sp.]|nr:nitroreductase family protein [Alistipes sp.]
MERTCEEVFKHRRSYYDLSAESPVTDAQIERILHFALKHIPSAFNSQSTRLVLLLHEHHAALWKMVKRRLRAVVPEETFARTAEKVDRSFAAGYGTVLFYEDMSVIRSLQQRFPLYAGNFPTWSEHTSAMHQLTVWTMLENAGFGASLQHYNPLIDKDVRIQWRLPEEWRLIAQMPFGLPAAAPPEKTFEPVDARMRIFR